MNCPYLALSRYLIIRRGAEAPARKRGSRPALQKAAEFIPRHGDVRNRPSPKTRPTFTEPHSVATVTNAG